MSRGLLAALLLHLVLATAYAFTTPACEGPDEAGHWYYAFRLANSGRLPIMRFTSQPLGRPIIDEAGLAHHPPLYYALLAGVLRLTGHADMVTSRVVHHGQNPKEAPDGMTLWMHGADEVWPASSEVCFFRFLRLGSVVCGLLSIALTWKLGRLAFPEQRAVADTAALLMAALPGWSFNHGVLENGALATTLSHAVLVVVCAAIVARRWNARVTLTASVLLGLGLITKLTTLALVPLVGLVALVAAFRSRERLRASGLIALGAAVVVALSGWFFVRNAQLYGDVLGVAAHRRVYVNSLIQPGHVLEWLRDGFFPNIFASLVSASVPWIGPIDAWRVVLGSIVAALAACGLVLGLVRRDLGARRPVVLVLVGAAALVFAATLDFNLTFMQPQGRYLFPALGPMAVIVAAGLVRLGAPLAPRTRRMAGLAGAAAAITIAAFAGAQEFVRGLVLTPAASSPLFATFTAHATALPALPELEITGPPEGSRLAAPPTLAWTPDEDPATRYAIYIASGDGCLYLTSHEWMQLELEGSAWTIPDLAWQSLPADTELTWNVKAIADRTRHERPQDMPAGPGRHFVRVR